MFKGLAKIWKDTATNTATGEYSQKRIMKWFAFAVGLFMCVADVVELHFSHGFDVQIRRPQEAIVGLLLLYSLGESVATLAGKYLNRKTADDNGNPLAPAAENKPE